MRKKMPIQQKTALEMILAQDGHGGMSQEAILLHKKQAEDAEKMEKRMSEIEKKVDCLDKKVDTLDEKIEEIKTIISTKTSFVGNLKEVLSNKVFLYVLITIFSIIFGINVSEVGLFLFK